MIPGSIIVGSGIRTAAVEFNKAAGTSTYTAKDCVSTTAGSILRFPLASVPGGDGSIIRAHVTLGSITAMLGAVLRLHLFSAAPTAIADNDPFKLLWANRAARLGFIDFPATVAAGAGSDTSHGSWTGTRFPFHCADNDDALYGQLEITTAGAAPADAQAIYIRLVSEAY